MDSIGNAALGIAIIVHLAVTTTVVINGIRHGKKRTKYFPLLAAANFVVFVLFLRICLFFFGSDNLLDVGASLVYSAIIAYVLSLELPGYLMLSKYDERLSESLQLIRSNVLPLMDFSLDKIDGIEKEYAARKQDFRELQISDLLEEFTSSSKRMNNTNPNLYQVILKELGDRILLVSNRSKHPFPKLIEILSLAGVAFILGQFLQVFGNFE